MVEVVDHNLDLLAFRVVRVLLENGYLGFSLLDTLVEFVDLVLELDHEPALVIIHVHGYLALSNLHALLLVNKVLDFINELLVTLSLLLDYL